MRVCDFRPLATSKRVICKLESTAPLRETFTVSVKTANGTVHAAPVELDRVEIADLTVHNVAAMVLPEGALSDNLLGLSFLSRLHRWEFADGKLVLEQ